MPTNMPLTDQLLLIETLAQSPTANQWWVEKARVAQDFAIQLVAEGRPTLALRWHAKATDAVIRACSKRP